MKKWMTGMLMLCTLCIYSQEWLEDSNLPEELGDVHWMRDYDAAIAKATKESKPAFIQFQEVPGCSTCKNYGNNLLTHPLVVELLETYFIPLAIYNNKRGKDADILQKFNEPSWNNPVARVINPLSQKDITKRLNGRYDMHSLLNTIHAGILASGEIPPKYLEILIQEFGAAAPRETHLSMYCFWSGEKALANMEGVLATKAGYMNGTEVVKVKYDANVLDENTLIKYAQQQKCADAIYTSDYREIQAAEKLRIPSKKQGKFRSDKQPKYYLHNTDYRYVPMTGLQALKVNLAISRRQSPTEFLSPRQLILMENIAKGTYAKEDVVDKDISKAWANYLLD